MKEGFIMLEVLNKKVTDLIAAGFKVIHLNLNRAYNALIAILGLIPVAYLGYVLMNANQHSQNMATTLTASPYATVMLIVSLLDVVSAYTLWNFRSLLLQHRGLFRRTMGLLTVLQLLIGNVVLVVAGLACLYFSKQIPDPDYPKHQQITVILSVMSFMYVFCLLVIVKLIIH